MGGVLAASGFQTLPPTGESEDNTQLRVLDTWKVERVKNTNVLHRKRKNCSSGKHLIMN